MKSLKLMLALSLSFYYLPGFAAPQNIDTTPPASEGALPAEQTPPLSSTQAQTPVDNNPVASAPVATATPSDAPTQAPRSTTPDSLPMPHDGHGPVVMPAQPQTPPTTNPQQMLLAPGKNMSSMNTKKAIPTRAEIDNELSP